VMLVAIAACLQLCQAYAAAEGPPRNGCSTSTLNNVAGKAASGPCTDRASGTTIPEGESCAPACEAGFTPSVASLDCTNGALGTFTCDDLSCAVPAVTNSASPCDEGQSISAGTACTPKCDDGYIPVVPGGAATLSCSNAGVLSPANFVCQASCATPTLLHGKASGTCLAGEEVDGSAHGAPASAVLVGSSCTVQCATGYTASNATITCEAPDASALGTFGEVSCKSDLVLWGGSRGCYDPKEVAYVSTDTLANAEFWQKRCKLIGNSGSRHPEITSVMMKMGSTHDFFRPTGTSDWCDMLKAADKHQFSIDGSTWSTPTYYTAQASDTFVPLGGSGENGDTANQRTWVSFWGSNSYKGGCCTNDLNNGQEDTWRKSFTMYKCSRCGLVGEYSGAAQLTREYWKDHVCDQGHIPSSAKVIRITIGSAVDYFRPKSSGDSLCDMLQANNKHEWSPDSSTWYTPQYTSDLDALGGSALDWPSSIHVADTRKYITFWGHQTEAGAGCSSSLEDDCADPDANDCFDFQHSMVVEYCHD